MPEQFDFEAIGKSVYSTAKVSQLLVRTTIKIMTCFSCSNQFCLLLQADVSITSQVEVHSSHFKAGDHLSAPMRKDIAQVAAIQLGTH